MIKKVLFIVMLSIAGAACGGEVSYCDEMFFVAGLNICPQDSNMYLNQFEIQRHVEVVEEVAIEVYGKDRIDKPLMEVLESRNVTIIFTSDILAFKCKEVAYKAYECELLVGGFNSQGTNIWVRYFPYDPCLSYGALAHELLHTIEEFYFGNSTTDHTTDKMFIVGAVNSEQPVGETVEWIAKNRLIQEFCPEEE